MNLPIECIDFEIPRDYALHACYNVYLCFFLYYLDKKKSAGVGPFLTDTDIDTTKIG